MNEQEHHTVEFIHDFGQVAAKKAIRCRAGRYQKERMALVNPEVARLGHLIRAERISRGVTRRALSLQARVDYLWLVLLEHGLLDSPDDFGPGGQRVMAALDLGEKPFEQTATKEANREKSPTLLAWGKRLLVGADFVFLVLAAWLLSSQVGQAWPGSPMLWTALVGGIIFLAGEKLACHYWVLAGQWGDRAYALPAGAARDRCLHQREKAEIRFRAAIGLGGLALLLLIGTTYLPFSTDTLTSLMPALAGVVLFCGYRILALAYWRDAARWRDRAKALLQGTHPGRATRNRDNAYRLFWLCGLFMLGGAVVIVTAGRSLYLARMGLGLAFAWLLYLGIRFVLGRYYVDIDLLPRKM